MTMVARWLGIARSLRMYYGDPSQTGRMARFYRRFIKPGELCFDVGAHVGSRIPALMRLGARVVAVEPHPICLALLRRLYGRRHNVTLVGQAVGAQPGEQMLLVCDREPTVSTLSRDWAAQVKRARPNFAGVRWDRRVTVPVTTLDALIDQHGEPAFCKIDVEGYDLEVLKGLSRPVRALSYECVPPAIDLAIAGLDRLGGLGPYEFNYSAGESMRPHFPRWVGRDDLAALLQSFPADGECGDVYARLPVPPSHSSTV